MIEVRFEVLGEKIIRKRLTRLETGLTNFSSSFSKIKVRFYEGEKKQFDTEGMWGSGGWAPLNRKSATGESYFKWKQRNYPGKPILEATGKLRDSLTNPRNVNAINKTTPTSMTLGTKVKNRRKQPYSIFHQILITPNRSFPERKVIALPKRERLAWTKIIHRDLWGKVEK